MSAVLDAVVFELVVVGIVFSFLSAYLLAEFLVLCLSQTVEGGIGDSIRAVEKLFQNASNSSAVPSSAGFAVSVNDYLSVMKL